MSWAGWSPATLDQAFARWCFTVECDRPRRCAGASFDPATRTAATTTLTSRSVARARRSRVGARADPRRLRADGRDSPGLAGPGRSGARRRGPRAGRSERPGPARRGPELRARQWVWPRGGPAASETAGLAGGAAVNLSAPRPRSASSGCRFVAGPGFDQLAGLQRCGRPLATRFAA